MSKLETNGFEIVRDGFDAALGLKCVKKKNVDYKCIKESIDNKYLPAISKHLPDGDSPIFRRFTVYNSGSSSLSSLYGSNSHNHTSTSNVPIYCAYYFFTSGKMEVIPGSHIKINKLNYSSRKEIHLKSGDVVILNTNLHHRDINDISGKTMILKVLDIFPNVKIYDEYSHNMVVVQMNQSIIIKSMILALIYISRIRILIAPLNFVYYVAVYYGIQHMFLLEDMSASSKMGKLIAYEANSRKNINEVSKAEPWNMIIIINKTIQTKLVGNTLLFILIIAFFLGLVITYYGLKNKQVIQILKQIYQQIVPNDIKDLLSKYKIQV